MNAIKAIQKYQRAVELYFGGDYLSALPLFKRALKFLDDTSNTELENPMMCEMVVDGYRMLGDCLFQDGRFKDALRCYDKSTESMKLPGYEGHQEPCASDNRNICAAFLETEDATP